MNRIVKLAFLFITIPTISFAQGQATGIKMITSIDPVFPVEAKNHTYGESIRVAVNVDDQGKVTTARVFGPLVPCSNLKDPVVTAIQEAAIAAAKKSVFEPVLKDGKVVDMSFTITYRLRPKRVEETKSITSGVRNGKAISLPKPSYPDAARANHIGGVVKISVLIGEDGTIISASPISGHPDLVQGAIEAACKARYSPTTVAGQPVKITASIAYNFAP